MTPNKVNLKWQSCAEDIESWFNKLKRKKILDVVKLLNDKWNLKKSLACTKGSFVLSGTSLLVHTNFCKLLNQYVLYNDKCKYYFKYTLHTLELYYITISWEYSRNRDATILEKLFGKVWWEGDISSFQYSHCPRAYSPSPQSQCRLPLRSLEYFC